MAPQLWRRQLDAGAWGITAATVGQARVMLAAGVRRVLIANEVTDAPAVGWIAAQLRDPGVEIVCSVDSPRGVELLAAGMQEIEGVPRPLPVLVELGHPGGRTGSRTVDARARGRSPGDEDAPARPGGRDRLRRDDLPRPHTGLPRGGPRRSSTGSRRSPSRLRADGLVETDETWVSAGGSTFFDLVVERLGPSGGVADRVLLRSGRYVAHDAGENERASPFAHHEPERRFHSAIEAWGAVLSRPEPDLAILDFGRRDVPFDQDLPDRRSRSGAGPANGSTSRAPWSSSG